ncbi:hypothetical protein D9M71_773620 [compost metagenome]
MRVALLAHLFELLRIPGDPLPKRLLADNVFRPFPMLRRDERIRQHIAIRIARWGEIEPGREQNHGQAPRDKNEFV